MGSDSAGLMMEGFSGMVGNQVSESGFAFAIYFLAASSAKASMKHRLITESPIKISMGLP